MLYVAEDLTYLKPNDSLSLRDKAEKLSRGIAAFTITFVPNFRCFAL